MQTKCVIAAIVCGMILRQQSTAADLITPIEVKNDASCVVWRANIGRDAGTPVVVGDCVVVGSDNNSDDNGDQRGCVYCFENATGKLRWKSLHERIVDRNRDIGCGLIEKPATDDSSVFYFNNRAEVICESLAAARNGHKPSRKWKVDLPKDHGVFFRVSVDVFNPYPSPLLVGDTVYCVTGNGSIHAGSSPRGKSGFVPFPDAPSFIALDAKSGKVKWSSSAPGENIFFGQWGSPAYVEVDGQKAILFPGGDGILYALDPTTGKKKGALNLNPNANTKWKQTERGDGQLVLNKPLVTKDGLIFVGMHNGICSGTRGRPQTGAIVCVDARALLSGRKSELWRFENDLFEGTIGDLAIVNNILFAVGESGSVVALDSNNGRCHWFVEGDGAVQLCAGITARQKRIYVPSGEKLIVYEASREPRVVEKYNFDNRIHGAVTFDDASMFVSTYGSLWRIRISP